MNFIINMVLIVILALCVWSGYRHGIIRSIAGLLAAIVALVSASMLADKFSKEIVPALNPFISGFIDSETTNTEVLNKMQYGNSDKSLEDILAQDSSLRSEYAYQCLRYAGLYEDVSIDLAQDCVTVAEKNNIGMTEAVITVICNTVSYVGCVTVAFLMIFILLSALIDLFNLDLRLGNMPMLDEIGGSVLGLVKGFFFCVLLSWLLGFLGIVIGKETSDKCALLNFFQAFRFITRSLI